ncbi:MAG: peptidase M16 [Hydrogenophilales bacterium 28-61-23]|nr:MAG: peptidase M16 [Hydrogenophilales bacterium 28-61-23]
MFAKSVLFFFSALLFAPAVLAGLNIQSWTTSQGARVVFVENHDLPMLDLSVDFSAGSARDSREKSGLANLTSHLMTLGAGVYSERDIAEKLADVGAVMSGRFDADRAGLSLRTLSGKAERDQSVSVLAAILSQPRFDAAVLEREKARVVAGLEEAATKPENIGEKAFQAALYGDHPYGLNEAGEVATVKVLMPDDLAAFHRAHYRAKNMVVALMGDVSRAEAAAIAERLAADLPRGEPPAPIAAVRINAQGRETTIPHHATQSHLFMGQPGIKREDPDYFPLYVGNYVLGGGGFDSRLMDAIRQKKGLAYSVYSYFAPMQELGPFQIGLQTRRDATLEAVRTAREELARYLAEGPSETELAQAKNNLIGGFPLRIDSNKKILEYLAVIGFYRLPLDWLDTYSAKVAAVTREDILRAFRARVKPEAMMAVIVGGQSEAGQSEGAAK